MGLLEGISRGILGVKSIAQLKILGWAACMGVARACMGCQVFQGRGGISSFFAVSFQLREPR